jgi:hypothetical protein
MVTDGAAIRVHIRISPSIIRAGLGDRIIAASVLSAVQFIGLGSAPKRQHHDNE